MAPRWLVAALALGLAAVPTAAGAGAPTEAPATTTAPPAPTEPSATTAAVPAPAETTIEVSDAGEYFAALAALSADASGPHTLVITDHFDVTSGVDPTYTGTQPLTIEGNDFAHALGGANRFLVFDSDANLTIRDLWVQAGRASFAGPLGSNGGAIDYRGTGGLEITSSVFDGNQAFRGGAVASLSAPVTIEDSAFTSNRADVGGALILGDGRITNSTIAWNLAGQGGGVHVSLGSGQVDLVHVTLAENRAGSGVSLSSNRTAAVDLTATALVDPSTGRNCALPGGPVADRYSFADDASCRLGPTSITDPEGPDPLGPLQGDLDFQVTMQPTADGPLVDAVPPAACTTPDDQRGITRPQEGDGVPPTWCDIGAVELEGRLAPAPPGPVPASPAFTG